MSKMELYVCCHRETEVPHDPPYVPIQVGAALAENRFPGFVYDDAGDNISAKNPHYCELTALYWAWKHARADSVGLVHYRRYFAEGRRIAGAAAIARALEKAPVILPRPRHYWIETNYSHYIHAHHEADLAVTRAVLQERCPDCLPAYDSQMKKRSGHRFNMFVMRRDLLDAYCTWLFPILFAVEERLDISGYDAYNARVFGFLAERLLDVWIETNRVSYTELPVKNTESQHWLRKGGSFVLRKFGVRVR